MADSEQRQIETDLLFWHRYAAGGVHRQMADEMDRRILEALRPHTPSLKPLARAYIQNPQQYGKSTVIQDIKDALAKVENAKQTLLVHPARKAQIEKHVEAEGLQHLVRVMQTPYIDADVAYVMSHHTVDLPKEESP